ncbi:MAG: VOC family protein [Acidobacteriia bacterium]|nr:VOC family protein [Terriglobia bacterium]
MTKNYSAAVPVISTSNVIETVRYFEQTLGFEQQWIWGDPPVYAGLKAGGATLYITHDPDTANAIGERGLAPDIFLWVSDIDSVYEQHRANDADIVEQLATRVWGARQYVIREPNGYRLKVAEPYEKEEKPNSDAVSPATASR